MCACHLHLVDWTSFFKILLFIVSKVYINYRCLIGISIKHLVGFEWATALYGRLQPNGVLGVSDQPSILYSNSLRLSAHEFILRFLLVYTKTQE